MKAQRIVFLLLLLPLLMSSLPACSPGHSGSDLIAFIRNGRLWTIDPDGANAFETIAQNTPIIGYSWSPDHQILVFRTLDSDFSKTATGRHIQPQAVTGAFGDLPSALNTIGVDGGTPITIIGSQIDLQHSNAWWNTSGDRLLYRETTPGASFPSGAFWWISQSDQPAGIARHLLPNSNSIPSINGPGQTTIGNSQLGAFTTTLTGANKRFLIKERLAGHPLIASLERLLWQPNRANPDLLYALENTSQVRTSSPTSTLSIKLVLRNLAGSERTITACTCTQFAWAPDGQHILTADGSTYRVLDLQGTVVASMTGEPDSVPTWSPDGHFLLLDNLHTLQLLNIQHNYIQLLLQDNHRSSANAESEQTPPGTNVLLQPLANSPWAADSLHLLFLTRDRHNWQGRQLKPGLYNLTINAHGTPQDMPLLVDNGDDSQPGWTYEQPETSFLY